MYRHWTRRLTYTEGVHDFAEKYGAFWWLDLIASHQPHVKRKISQAGDRDFQVWELEVNPDHTAVARCHNGKDDLEKEIYKKQRIEYTDFPETEECKVWVVDGVILLPSEY